MTKKEYTAFKRRYLKSDNPTLKLTIQNFKCDVEVNPEVYDEDDKKRLKNIINRMSKTIWLDKTYVCFKGNRWKDAFIVEDKWYEFIKLIIKTDFGRTGSIEDTDTITEAIAALVLGYLYGVASKYDFSIEDIEITPKKKVKFIAEYEEDKRTDWRF